MPLWKSWFLPSNKVYTTLSRYDLVCNSRAAEADSQSMPILIALETSEDPTIAEQALSLHAHLHTKHSSLVTIRYLEFSRASYDYQRTITAEPFGHRQGQALLQGWYGLISEKRVWRLDFLRSFVRAFDYDLAKKEVVSPRSDPPVTSAAHSSHSLT